MMRSNKIELIAGGALAAISGAALATYLYRNNNRPYNRKFDKNSIEEIKGVVESVLYRGHKNGERRGVELLLRANDELLSVHVGPAWYLNHQSEKIKTGDKIIVRGSKMVYKRKPVLIAETITNDNLSFRLRDNEGHPLWKAFKSNKAEK